MEGDFGVFVVEYDKVGVGGEGGVVLVFVGCVC